MHESQISHGIRVEVESFFVPEQSDTTSEYFFFSYRVKIQNGSDRAVQLLTRHWIITDGRGRIEEVKGDGVVGQQPTIDPGTTFEYESFCPLATPTGVMRGTYEMIRVENGETFHAQIPQFFLVEPSNFH